MAWSVFVGARAVQRAGASGEEGGGARFQTLAREYINGYLVWRPQEGTALGLHQYDGRITDPGAASIAAELARLKRSRLALAGLSPASLSVEESHDLRTLSCAIDNEILSIEELRAYTRNPMTYARALDVSIYIKRDFAPLRDRLKSITAIESQAPALFRAARANLEVSLPRPYIETAVEIADGSAEFLSHDLVEALKTLKTSEPGLYSEFSLANDRAVAELKSFAQWLEKERLPKAGDQFAIGREKYQRMLSEGELVDYPPEKILEIGLRELKREQAVFVQAAREIDPARPPVEVFQAIQIDHPTAEGLLPGVRKNLEAIRKFVVDHRIITLPSEVRARVEETLQFDRASSFASMDTPGPFETKATEAYYYVTPVEKEWPPKQQEEWLTAFNRYTTDVVSIHEVYPGHYTQFLVLNASKATDLEKIFSSYAFVEGWAHYSEQMLLDEGFGAEGGPVQAAKYRLAQSDEALLRTCRLCVSVKMHCQGMTVEEGAKFFRENCYYEEKPAKSEAMRGTFDPGYLYYTLGKLEILKLRRDWRRQEGAAYSLLRFHQELLRHGAPPIRLLRERMLRDRAIWGEIL